MGDVEFSEFKISYNENDKANIKEKKKSLKLSLKSYKNGDVKESLKIADCLFELKKYKKAIPYYLKFLELKNYIYYSQACKKLGDIYFNGLGVKADSATGIKYYEKAAEYDSEMKKFLGDMYYNGNGVEKNYRKAYDCYKQIAKKDNKYLPFCAEFSRNNNCYEAFELNSLVMESDDNAKLYIAEALYDRRDYEKAAELFSDLMKKGDSSAYLPLGKMLLFDLCEKSDYKKAFKALKKAADSGISAAWAYLGDCYYFGKGTDQDKDLGIACYKKGIQEDHAKYMIARIELTENPNSPQKSTCIDYLETAARSSHRASVFIARLIREGVTGFRYMHNPADICEKAIKENVAEAYVERGYIYFDKKDYENAYKDFKKAHELGVPEAAAPLAKCYKSGLGVKANEEKADKIINSADDKDSLLYKAKCLIDEKKNEEAKKILCKITNNDDASYTLGMLHKKDKELEAAFNAFAKCSNTHDKAKIEYIKCLYYGKGTTENKKSAMLLAKNAKTLDGELNYLLAKAYDAGGVFGYSFDLAKKYYYASAKQKYKKAVEMIAKIEEAEAAEKAAQEEAKRKEEELNRKILEIKYTLKNKYKDDVISIPSIHFSINKNEFGIYASGDLTFKFNLSYAFEEAKITALGSLTVQYESDDKLEKFKNRIIDHMNEYVRDFLAKRPDYPFKLIIETDYTIYNYK